MKADSNASFSFVEDPISLPRFSGNDFRIKRALKEAV
jgi:hypothetical protein